MVQAQNAQIDDTWFAIPQFLGAATQPGPNSPNGTLGFISIGMGGVGLSNGNYGVTIWYND